MIKQLRYLLKKRTLSPRSVQVISYPKSGRTWLTVMVGEYFKRTTDISVSDVMDIENYSQNFKGVPRIKFGHDDRPLIKTPSELETDKSKYRDDKVILIVRDPKDIIVSAFFERTKRIIHYDKTFPQWTGTISEYIRQDRGGVDTIVRFFNNWYENRSVPIAFEIIRYEDMVKDPNKSLIRVLKFIGVKDVNIELTNEVAEFCSFENMQKLERENQFASVYLKPGDVNDVESYKVRRGKVGGYRDYLSDDDVRFLQNRIAQSLNKVFGY